MRLYVSLPLPGPFRIGAGMRISGRKTGKGLAAWLTWRPRRGPR